MRHLDIGNLNECVCVGGGGGLSLKINPNPGKVSPLYWICLKIMACMVMANVKAFRGKTDKVTNR